jgi:hypothetical protein
MLVSIVLSQTPLNIGFRRPLNDNTWNDWLHLCHRPMTVQLSQILDAFK